MVPQVVKHRLGLFFGNMLLLKRNEQSRSLVNRKAYNGPTQTFQCLHVSPKVVLFKIYVESLHQFLIPAMNSELCAGLIRMVHFGGHTLSVEILELL